MSEHTAGAGGDGPRGIGEIIVSSRPYDEYLAMFGLTEREVLAGPVLDCPGGAGPFGAAVRARGGRAVSADPAYALPPAEIVAQVRAGLEHGIRYLGENEESYVWTFFSSLDDLRRRRGAALEEFARDFRGPDPRYVVAALPGLPFDDGAFRLVLSAYLLFAYPDHLDEEGHERALRELLRVAREEVRVFPLIDTAYVRHPALDVLRRRLAADGVDSEVRRVDYEFQRGGDEVLVLRPGVTGSALPGPVRHGRALAVPHRRLARPDLPALPLEGHARRAAARRPRHAGAGRLVLAAGARVVRLSSKSHWDLPISDRRRGRSTSWSAIRRRRCSTGPRTATACATPTRSASGRTT